jgi:hypothetical protein
MAEDFHRMAAVDPLLLVATVSFRELARAVNLDISAGT